jgi:hypothetical protein
MAEDTTTEPTEPPSKERTGWLGEKRLEFVSVVVLAVAALATAWSGYQASLWDGIQSSDYTQASGARTNAAQQRTASNQLRLADLGMFENYVDARIDGDEQVADFYQQRFRDEFQVAFDAWVALDPFNNPDAPATPFAMPEYTLATDAEAESLEERADTLFATGEEANTISDIYTLSTLLFAAGLFFAAISERFEYLTPRLILLGIAVLAVLVGIGVAVGQPVTAG